MQIGESYYHIEQRERIILHVEVAVIIENGPVEYQQQLQSIGVGGLLLRRLPFLRTESALGNGFGHIAGDITENLGVRPEFVRPLFVDDVRVLRFFGEVVTRQRLDRVPRSFRSNVSGLEMRTPRFLPVRFILRFGAARDICSGRLKALSGRLAPVIDLKCCSLVSISGQAFRDAPSVLSVLSVRPSSFPYLTADDRRIIK